MAWSHITPSARRKVLGGGLLRGLLGIIRNCAKSGGLLRGLPLDYSQFGLDYCGIPGIILASTIFFVEILNKHHQPPTRLASFFCNHPLSLWPIVLLFEFLVDWAMVEKEPTKAPASRA